jgi:fatty-acyl-CoA synthase
MPHEKWGETPCACVELAEGQVADAAALRTWCRDHLAPYKVPGQFVFTSIPRTSTGKIQKFLLRERAREMTQFKSEAV